MLQAENILVINRQNLQPLTAKQNELMLAKGCVRVYLREAKRCWCLSKQNSVDNASKKIHVLLAGPTKTWHHRLGQFPLETFFYQLSQCLDQHQKGARCQYTVYILQTSGSH